MLRVSSGKAKGKKLFVPKGKKVRPTTARVKQSIFDTIYDFKNKTVLDIFAGSGALGIESLSRGASHVIFVENDLKVIQLLKKNLESCKLSSQYSILALDYNKAIKKLTKDNRTFDLIFIDPPFGLYETKKAYELIEQAGGLLEQGGIMIIEHTQPLEYENTKFLISTKKYGSNFVSFIEHNNE
ncbi:MAG: 16S rRNA (guanine(966)-N(2))-methyltransferase RsmD [Candidatus Dadabacteria bacterium]|nr:16S rRNA (guanine(966)-N(2))-methyltransferase RsmD [Candidatus Dadabacteria bacterium]NIS08614.1 16S rRNA (guanine(966)-N(2))-methyltransferase RsmD [Candidatus Dadabacteria bacterium]NIV42397.1 16S rRNA (guanine(966)-N(2))-methyltransferase RsmD [Candidatus Dadabacteria bacterium]NIY22319.1 16S rRNA (guanine(966)-N(2))-methyltransferase RsmD [Candidatus Dadabacteria bacterium]